MTSAPPAKVAFVLGGARSGKSAFAEGLVGQSGRAKVYVATGRAFDTEMQARIARHQADRGEGWTTIEAPLDLVGALRRETLPNRMVLVDCLTLWVTNLMMAGSDIEAECAELIDCLGEGLPGPVVLVSNEVGLGIVPENRMAREFRDHAGRLHQQIAAVAETVTFVAAGLPMKLKG
ncbi:bifunctional adenosylcobinamide kinase/adenosylcobinamide-phosphate guanylyltransferase [Jiella mangrovi]|uniref:Bifunctional adenosylcobalamin biosynthesis protein n=1 Tax=Jiella mangrovi TaxID=2821407 RepID=A0ABS4BM85_9HYPH|nr:bifunctional adenosylcobinamide kinase/adenosylcobinamide-phosphate guanylyltransferase [Jiella mangrovi]MBP0617299.1 bifunctional adenosylcobinamide kinase/adenosylcobinamide-phosphate guanylyltransferase [Jiella mangrovi]